MRQPPTNPLQPHDGEPTPLSDDLLRELMAAEAKAVMSAGRIPEEVPGASPQFENDLLSIWRRCEDRLRENGRGGQLHRDARKGNAWTLSFHMTGSRSGLWLTEGCAAAYPFREAPPGLLAEHTRYLPDLERMLGVEALRGAIDMSEKEAILKRHGLLP